MRQQPSRRPVILLAFALLTLVLGATAAWAAPQDPNATCLACHNKPAVTEELQASVHAQNACITCHADRQQFPHAATETAQLRQQVEQSCLACHNKLASEYRESIHRAVGTGCASCHGGGHSVVKTDSPQSPVQRANLATTCTKCHGGEVAESYAESFHGKAVALGSSRAATCTDCHGDHGIVKAEESNSPVSAANVPQTCAKCHGTAAAGFAQGKEHFVLESKGPGAPMYYTFKFFTWLTIAVMVLLIIHIELELWRRYRNAGKEA